jgi:hypothetical protein
MPSARSASLLVVVNWIEELMVEMCITAERSVCHVNFGINPERVMMIFYVK